MHKIDDRPNEFRNFSNDIPVLTPHEYPTVIDQKQWNLMIYSWWKPWKINLLKNDWKEIGFWIWCYLKTRISTHWIEHKLRPHVNSPLTVVRPVATGWRGASGSERGGLSVTSTRLLVLQFRHQLAEIVAWGGQLLPWLVEQLLRKWQIRLKKFQLCFRTFY